MFPVWRPKLFTDTQRCFNVTVLTSDNYICVHKKWLAVAVAHMTLVNET